MHLAALDQAALDVGLAINMTLADARARLPRLRVEAMDAAADHRLLLRLAASCEFFTPLVSLDLPDGLILDVTGCAHLFNGEGGLLEDVRKRLRLCGLDARVSIASTPEAARALARFTAIGIVLPAEEAAVARQLPVTALGADTETTLALARAGLERLGDLADRSRQALAARFGKELVTVLDRILGLEDVRLTPLRIPPERMVERHFPSPLSSMDALLNVLDALMREVARLLEVQGEGGRLFEVIFFRADGEARRLVLETAQASRDVKGLLRLFRLKIETLADPLDPGFGFDAVRLAVLRSEPLHASQCTFDGRAHEDANAVADLVDRLVTRFGRDRVLQFIAQDTHDPIHAAVATPFSSSATSGEWPEVEHGAPPLRPLTVFEPPQPIGVLAEVPDGPPIRFRWRRVLHAVTRAEGPERIAPEWWRAGAEMPTRDYYRIEDERGHRFWVFREGLYEDAQPRWFLHGLFA